MLKVNKVGRYKKGLSKSYKIHLGFQIHLVSSQTSEKWDHNNNSTCNN